MKKVNVAALALAVFGGSPALAEQESGVQPATGAPADSAQFVLAEVDAFAATSDKVARQIWEWAEVGYQEQRSSRLLQDHLKAEGFTIETGVAGIPTAFVASWGKGSTVIGILAEFDALPGVNQDAVPVRAPIEDKTAAHACGHNLFAAGSLGAAIAVKKWLQKTGKPGVIRVYGTPAEEGGSGKVYMVRAGLFDDVDIALHWHADDENSAGARSSLANKSAKFRFTGIPAHASGSPHKGRSALDGVEAMNLMVNMMREHIPQETRIHYVITRGGEAPNVVPEFAEVFYYVRHPEVKRVQEIWARVESAAQGAALGTGTKVEWEIIHGNNPVLVNETLARMMDHKLRSVGGIRYTKDEEAFARTLFASFDEPTKKIGDQVNIEPYRRYTGGGSTDVGDVSYATPTVGVRVAAWVPGTPGHSWQSAATAGTSIGFKAARSASKVLALGAIELFENDELRAAARTEFDEARGADYKYTSLLGDRKPPLDYRE
jgi:aminobenzoyl-glutamate utilization protein B